MRRSRFYGFVVLAGLGAGVALFVSYVPEGTIPHSKALSGGEADAPTREESSPVRDLSPRTPIPPEQARFEARGRIEVVGSDAQGGPVSGRFGLRVGPEVEWIEFVDSIWSARLPAGRLVLEGAFLRDRPAFPLDDALVIGPSEATRIVRIAARPCVRVLDAATSAELPRAEIVATARIGVGSSHLHPGRALPSPRMQGAPIDKASIAPGQYWVRADGYAWKQTYIPPADAEPVTDVGLVPGGKLVLRVGALPPDLRSVELDVAGEVGTPLIRMEGFQGEKTFRGLPPERLLVTLTGTGPLLGEAARVLAEARPEIRPGEETRVVLEADGRAGARLVQVSGSITIEAGPAALGPRIDRVMLHPRSAIRGRASRSLVLRHGEGVPEDPERGFWELRGGSERGYWEWGPIGIASGRYEIEMEPIGVKTVVEVPDVPRHEIRIALPRFFETEIRFRDELTGGPVAVDMVWFANLLGARGVGDASSGGASVVEVGSDRLTVLATRAPLELTIFDEEYGARRRTVHPEPGKALTVSLVPKSLVPKFGVRFELHSRGREFFVASSWWKALEVKAVDGREALTRRALPPQALSADAISALANHGSSASLWELPGPGRYAVRLPGATEPEVVQVSEGTTVLVDVDTRSVTTKEE